MKRFSLRYCLLTSRLDLFWFPLSFWALFVAIGVIRGSEYIVDTSRAYLGAVLPLIGGILAAYAILDDPALELRFAAPVSAAQTLLERLAPLSAVLVSCAAAYEAFALLLGADFAPLYGNWARLQLTWLIPTLWSMAWGCLISFIAAQSISGALLVGLVWIVELAARGWFAGNAGKYVLIFMGPLIPEHPALGGNYMTLSALAVAFLLIAWALLRRQERFI